MNNIQGSTVNVYVPCELNIQYSIVNIGQPVEYKETAVEYPSPHVRSAKAMENVEKLMSNLRGHVTKHAALCNKVLDDIHKGASYKILGVRNGIVAMDYLVERAQFDDANINADNYGTYWSVDHIIPKHELKEDNWEDRHIEILSITNLRALRNKTNFSRNNNVKRSKSKDNNGALKEVCELDEAASSAGSSDVPVCSVPELPQATGDSVGGDQGLRQRCGSGMLPSLLGASK